MPTTPTPIPVRRLSVSARSLARRWSTIPFRTAAAVACAALAFTIAWPAAADDDIAAGPTERERPNFVLVLADDQGYGDMGYTGHPHVITPNFDAMAVNALRFDRFHAAAPVCSPTRGSLLTGRNPNRFGCHSWGHTLRPGEITFAMVLRDAGYHTGHFGKWHIGSVLPEGGANPGQFGFDRWISAPNFYENNPTLSDQGTATAYEGESSLLTMELALEWIEGLIADADNGQPAPFVAVVWFGSPHTPWISAEEFLQPYLDPDLGLSPQQAHFLGEVTGMDAAMGLLNARLEQLGLLDNTVVWYTSDNGALPNVGSAGPYRGKKGSIWQGGLRVPALLQWPAVIREGAVIDLPATTNDFYPTLLDLAGVEPPESQPELDGLSLAPWILDPSQPAERARGLGFWQIPSQGVRTPSEQMMTALLEAGNDVEALDDNLQFMHLRPDVGQVDRSRPAAFRRGHAAWIDGPWKLHRIVDGDDERWQLFHLEQDPGETEDLGVDHPERVEAMRRDLEAWQAAVIHDLNHPRD